MKKHLLCALFLAACVPPPAGTETTPVAGGDPAPVAEADDGDGPPAVRRMIPGLEAEASMPFERGDYLIALDYRDEGYGTYGFLYHGDNRWWFVENDQIVGGPHVDGGPEMQEVVAAWTAAENQRHQAAMQGIDSLPSGCLDGCAVDVYQGGQYQRTEIRY